MTPFNKELVPPGIDVRWKGWPLKWDSIDEIRVSVGTSGSEEDTGILKINHYLESDENTFFPPGAGAVVLLRSVGMEDEEVARATFRGVDTIKTHQKRAVKKLGDPAKAHLATQRMFDIGFIVVKKGLMPLIPPSRACQRFLKLLSTLPNYKEVGAYEEKALTRNQVVENVKYWRKTGELPRSLRNHPSLTLWWNALDKRFKQEVNA